MVSIHAPRPGCDMAVLGEDYVRQMFQSTHPARGATHEEKNDAILLNSFNPRTPGGVRLYLSNKRAIPCTVSIHAPRVGCDTQTGLSNYWNRVSIHAPRVGCDAGTAVITSITEVSIHAPRVGCDVAYINLRRNRIKFQSTHPGWGATVKSFVITPFLCFNPRTPGGVRPDIQRQQARIIQVSIHAPRVGCDEKSRSTEARHHRFNPRTPGGVRPS